MATIEVIVAPIDFEKTFSALTAALRKLETNSNVDKRRLEFEIVSQIFTRVKKANVQF